LERRTVWQTTENRRFAPPVIQTDNRWITGDGPPVNWLANSSG
jgi:hypothetical protein